LVDLLCRGHGAGAGDGRIASGFVISIEVSVGRLGDRGTRGSVGWRDGGMEGWRDGGMEGWWDGGMEGWSDAGLEGWREY